MRHPGAIGSACGQKRMLVSFLNYLPFFSRTTNLQNFDDNRSGISNTVDILPVSLKTARRLEISSRLITPIKGARMMREDEKTSRPIASPSRFERAKYLMVAKVSMPVTKEQVRILHAWFQSIEMLYSFFTHQDPMIKLGDIETINEMISPTI